MNEEELFQEIPTSPQQEEDNDSFDGQDYEEGK